MTAKQSKALAGDVIDGESWAGVSLVVTPLTLNRLLEDSGIDLRHVVVFRHRPWEPALNRVFDWIVSERRDLFECYQDSHTPRAEGALLKAKYVASFIRYRPKQALFVGLYEIASHRKLTIPEYLQRPAHIELMAHGMGGVMAGDGREHVVEFNLVPTGWQEHWSEQLIIEWPGLERSWYRWADRNVFPVVAITEESCLIGQVPAWDEIAVEWHQLALLPTNWKSALTHWRGIYLIIDQSDGLQYVGSAYGRENILQRWQEYARTGHGGNKGLRTRNPQNFRFSILQRTSPDLPDPEVIALEQSWKLRLRTQSPYGLNEN